MQATRILLVLALLCSLGRANACERNEFGVFENAGCASDALSVADIELNQIYKALLSSLDPEQQKALVVSQRAWLAFLKANAAFIYSVEGDGSSGRLVVMNTIEQQTNFRVKELANWKIAK